jgi:hypothetical protein
MPFSRLLVASLFLCSTIGALAQTAGTAAAGPYDPRVTFAPLTLPDAVNMYRSGNGAPGPDYWQNRADYVMHATLDTKDKTLRNDEVITYTNNSPDVLPSVWLHMEQNIYRKDSRASVGGSIPHRPGKHLPDDETNPNDRHTQGFELDSVEIETGKASGGSTVKADYLISDTRMQIRLPHPLAGHGAQVRIHIRYHYTIPGVWGGRTSWGTSKQGDIYDIAQWYPRMCVYDDLRGWDTLPYVGSEFYLEYGNFDYSLTVPGNMLVAGSGELVNPEQVLTPAENKRFHQAEASDKTVTIRSVADVNAALAGPQPAGMKTWHFRMQNTRDVSWSASPVFVWDAARIDLPDGKHSLAESFYPPESAGNAAWGRSSEDVKDTVERFSKHWFPYPWPAAINIAGYSTGMEYPGIVFDGVDDKGKELFWITAHEIGHSWFPMIVGSNERRTAFMDEGFNTFIDIEESADFDGGVYGPKRDSEYSAGGEPADTILKVLDNPDAPNILMPADAIPWQITHPVSYFKAAYGLTLLRDDILGHERFDWAFRKYIHDWAYKHPDPSDFFREMDSAGGEELDWFWRGWYMHNWRFDMAVTKIDGDSVTLENKDQLVLPATLGVKYADGTTASVTIPVEAWEKSGTMTWTGEKAVASATIDPEHVLPDDNRADNTLDAGH